MAKSSNKGGGDGSSRIRFIMLEAELGDGDFSQITQAITNALRPTQVVQRLIPVPAMAGSVIPTEEGVEEQDAEVVSEESPEGSAIGGRASARVVSSKSKGRPRSPKVVDVDLTSEPSFSGFVARKHPPSDQKRFLVVCAWFKEARGVDAITIDHVYTCYRSAGWPTNISDFDGHFRQLLKRQLVSRTNPGTYAINHLGIAEVEKLGAGTD
jgi:hypothetical protein